MLQFCLDLSLWTSTMQVLFVLGFYHSYKIDRSIHASSSKMAVKMSGVVKQLLYVLKLFRVTAGCIHSFRIRRKETFRIMYPKYPVLDMIRRIHLRYGSFGSIFLFFFDFRKDKRNKISVLALKKTFKNKCRQNCMFGLSATIRWESWVDEVNWLQ